MKRQIFKILFENDKAYLTNDKSWSFKELGLPDYVNKFDYPAHLVIRVLDHDKSKIFCEIIEYNKGKTNFDASQKRFSRELNSLKMISYKCILDKEMYRIISKIENTSSDNDSKEINIELNFSKSIDNIIFKEEKITFNNIIEKCRKSIEFSIPNNFIKSEYDSIKNYFFKVIKTDRINVRANVTIINKKPIFNQIYSPEVNRINSKLIKVVKEKVVKHNLRTETEDTLLEDIFTINEFTEHSKRLKTDVFWKNDDEALENLISLNDKRHYDHLRFLSERHLHKTMILRVIKKPYSFVFLLQGNTKYHFIWETLDSKEATYIWSLADSDIENWRSTWSQIKEKIQWINQNGREEYLNRNDDKFCRILHDYSDRTEGFNKWKSELENIMK